jgi:hypothetical protein
MRQLTNGAKPAMVRLLEAHAQPGTRHAGAQLAAPMKFALRYLAALALLATAGCSNGSGGNIEITYAGPRQCRFDIAEAGGATAQQTLRINEVMTGNDGAWVDERGETDDFVELINAGDQPVSLVHYSLGDKLGKATKLPDITVRPHTTVIVWADDDERQGPLHLPYKLSNSGTPLWLWADTCELVDSVEVPELPRSESYARLPDGDGDFQVCRYATPDRENGDSCGPPPPANLQDNVKFAPYTWPEPFPTIHGPLVLAELALQPAAFVEVLNASDRAVELSDYSLRLAAMPPGEPWP